MTSIFPDFPHSVDDEPTEEWTVEQTLQWWLLRAHGETDAEYEKMAESFTKQLEQGKTEIWDCHKQVVETLNAGGEQVPMDENVDPQQQGQNRTNNATTKSKSTTTKATTTTTTKATTVASNTIHIDIIAGEYKGKTYDLLPRHRAPCWVGRSQGKKFREKGISLPKDLEISTTHGKFELIRNTKLCFTDTGSTNGSRVNGQELEPDTPLDLESGMEILLGQTLLKVTLNQ